MGHLPEAGGGMGPDQAGEARGGMWAGRRRRAWGVGGRPEPDLGESRLLTVPQGHGGWKDAPWVVGDGDESGAAGEIGNFISELLYPKEKKKKSRGHVPREVWWGTELAGFSRRLGH